jgi:hypothetical protein
MTHRKVFALLIMFLFALTVSAFADDRAEIEKAAAKETNGFTIKNIRFLGGWALTHQVPRDSQKYEGNEGDIHKVLHKVEQKWYVMMTERGISLTPEELFFVGVPEKLWSKLLGREIPESVVKKAKTAEPPWSKIISKKKLSENDLRGRGFWELTIMKNEIYARHGRFFKEPELRRYFESRPWYKVNPKYDNSMLTEIENYNIRFISDYRRQNNLEW